MTRITRILRFGLRTSVHLACGHKLHVLAGDVLRQQLFIYKRYSFGQCVKEGRV